MANCVSDIETLWLVDLDGFVICPVVQRHWSKVFTLAIPGLGWRMRECVILWEGVAKAVGPCLRMTTTTSSTLYLITISLLAAGGWR